MIGRYLSILGALAAIAIPAGGLSGQVIRGPTEHTVCPTPFRPISGWTFHGGYAWAVTYHTFPFERRCGWCGHATGPVARRTGA